MMVFVVSTNFLDGSDSVYGVYSSLPKARHAIEEHLLANPHITHWVDSGNYLYYFKTDLGEQYYANIEYANLDEE